MNKRWKPNVTVAAVIERDFDGIRKFLLVEEETRDGLKLNNPAGHLDPGESPMQGCTRETLEETAFHFTPTALVGGYLSPSSLVCVFLSRFERVQPGEELPLDVTYLRFSFCGDLGAHVAGQALDKGIVRAVWLTVGEIRDSAPMHRSPLVLTSLEDYLAGRRFPLDVIRTDPSVLLPKK